MVQAETEMRERARDLRRAGRTCDGIVAELGVSKIGVAPGARPAGAPDTA
ncbi:hypothetical protein [Streptomyces lycii]|nr:hypothetical protein [Streptomyces lycii]